MIFRSQLYTCGTFHMACRACLLKMFAPSNKSGNSNLMCVVLRFGRLSNNGVQSTQVLLLQGESMRCVSWLGC